MVRLGLCCAFRDQPIKFRTATAAAMKRLTRREARKRLAERCRLNAEALMAALRFCSANGIGSFRVNSQVLPLATHPEFRYRLEELPDGRQHVERFRECGDYARQHGLRTTFHPDQFVVLNSPRPEVVEQSIQELEYQTEVAEWIGADVINIHAGGAFGDKRASLARFAQALRRLSRAARRRLTIENDDKLYTPSDLLPICGKHHVPLVYDVHHHRCNPDGLSAEEAAEQALATWNREPLFHVSSPLEGWDGPQPSRHHDYVNVQDFPAIWDDLDLTVEVEAKAKELAVKRLAEALVHRRETAKTRLRVISGGQTGVDRAALDVAIALGLPHGGWCPRGRRAEDGRIPVGYGLQETESSEYPVRTERNVVESDATLVLCRGRPAGGTDLTVRLARKHRRPCLIVDLLVPQPAAKVRRWLATHRVETLNVAGPRESQNPGIGGQADEYLRQVLEPTASGKT